MYKSKKQAIIESTLYASLLILAMLFQYNVFGMDKNAAQITASLLFLVGTIMLIASLNGLIKLVKATTNPAYKDISYDYKKGKIIYDLHQLGLTDEILLDMVDSAIIIIVKNNHQTVKLSVGTDKTIISKDVEGEEPQEVKLDSNLGKEEIYQKFYNFYNGIEEVQENLNEEPSNSNEEEEI